MRKRSNSERAPITARHSEERQAGKARVMRKFGEEHFGHAAHVQPNLFTDTIYTNEKQRKKTEGADDCPFLLQMSASQLV